MEILAAKPFLLLAVAYDFTIFNACIGIGILNHEHNITGHL